MEQFVSALHRSAEHQFSGSSADEKKVAAYLNSLHAEDLALAAACEHGREAAWDWFVRKFRPTLYAAGRAITRDADSGRELADSLYADLYGLGAASAGEPAGRRSLFRYYHGRSKLSTWLRAVLAQRHVDAIRASRRTEPLDDASQTAASSSVVAQGREAPSQPLNSAAFSIGGDPDRARYMALFQAAVERAIAALESRDRLRLACYYIEQMTLAEIGRLLGEHEATASRHLDRARREIRRNVERTLQAEKQLSAAEIRLCYEYAVEEWPFDLSGVLTAPRGKP